MGPSKQTQKRSTLATLAAERCKEGRIEEQARKSRAEGLLEDNRDTIEEWNRWVERNGLPLARYRQF